MSFFTIDPIEQREEAIHRLEEAEKRLKRAEKAYRKRPGPAALWELTDAVEASQLARARAAEWFV